MIYSTIISCKELLNHPSKELVIVDARHYLSDTTQGREEFERTHIPSAQHVHLDNDLSGEIIAGTTGRHPLPSSSKFQSVVQNLGITSSTQVVVYDQWHGGIASRLWWMLQAAGHKKVAVLNGGWKAWNEADFPVTHDAKEVLPSSYPLDIDLNLTTAVDTIEKIALAHESDVLVDSRTIPRYRGEKEPVDPIAGHIPRAVNYPFLENLDPNTGFWKNKKELQDRFSPIFTNKEAGNIHVYCGSGVTACHNLLSMVYAGYSMPQLYVGSWSHWITDQSRKVVKEV